MLYERSPTTDPMIPVLDDVPDEVSGNAVTCYICGRNFGDLARLLRECVIKLEHSFRRNKKNVHYTMCVCVWCYDGYIKEKAHHKDEPVPF